MNDVVETWYGDSPQSVAFDPKAFPVRFSRLKEMARSPAHYLESLKSEREDTAALKGGRAVHAVLFGTPLAVFTGAVRRGKAWDEFEREHVGQEILTATELAHARAMAAAVERHTEAKRLLADCTVEHELKWTHEVNRRCQSRVDAFNATRVVELKTTRCSDPARFVRDATWRNYHAQLAFYQDAVSHSGLGTPSEAYIVAVESSRPYPVTVLRLTDNAIDLGRRQCRLWLERLLVCEAFNQWPSYVESTVPFDVADESDDTIIIDGEEVEF